MRLLVCATVLLWLSAGAAGTAGADAATGTEAAAATEGMAGTGKWSPPATLSGCPGTGAPQVVFPSDKPTHGTGPGAIVWSVSSPCPGGAGVRVAALAPATDTPGPAAAPRTATGRALALRGPVAATGGPYGRVVLAAGTAAGSGTAAGELLLSEGRAGGPFAAPLAAGDAAGPFAFTTAYLGDVALLSLGAGHQRGPGGGGDGSGGGGGGGGGGGDDDAWLRVQRHHSDRFAAPRAVGAAGGAPIETLTVALDFRSEALAAWAQGGSVYARLLPAAGAPRPVQRLGSGALGIAAGARIAALLSDDDRAIVAWSERRGGQTSVYVAQSQPGVRFGAPRLLERFPDPPALPDYADSPRIVRLSSESVMIAWTGAADGHWVVRSAAIDQHGVGAPSTISPAGADALLADLASGPDDEALALWTEPQPTPAGLDLARQAIYAARGFDVAPRRTIFAAGEQVAPPGPSSDATVALDPDSDRAVAAWRGGAGAIEYAVRAGGAP